MTLEEKISFVKATIDNSDEELIKTYLAYAESIVYSRLYPFDEEVSDKPIPSKYDVNQCEIAGYLINKRGAEGESYHSENGVNRSYENANIPKSMLAPITPFAEVI